MAQEGKPSSEILTNPSLNEKREELQREIVKAGQLYGSPIDEKSLANTLESLRRQPVTAASSPQKLAEAMRLELPSNAGALLELMESKGIKLPSLRNLYDSLCRRTIVNE